MREGGEYALYIPNGCAVYLGAGMEDFVFFFETARLFSVILYENHALETNTKMDFESTNLAVDQ